MNRSPLDVVLAVFNKGDIKGPVFFSDVFKVSIVSRIAAEINIVIFVANHP